MQTNDEYWENRCREIGKLSGDLCFPLVFTPELHFSEFDSEVADMTNLMLVGPFFHHANNFYESISKTFYFKRMNNASSSCAGLFVHSHLGSDFDGIWIHLDIAYPSTSASRGTGYGVSLLNSMFGDSSENQLFKELGKAEN